MPIRSNLHTHTVYCDGVSTPREMAEAALASGFVSLGFSGHAYTSFDKSCCMTPTGTLAYRREVLSLREEYAGRLDLFLGLENDGAEPQDTAGYDYCIGSVHYLFVEGEQYTVDQSPEEMRRCIDLGYGGDALAMARAYYAKLAGYASGDDVDIVGHFDVIEKFNGNGRFFDTGSPAYQKTALAALEAIAQRGKVFEVNTGAMARGFRKTPYPAPFLLRRMLEMRTPILLSSDAHDAALLTAGFAEVSAMLYETGFRETAQLRRGEGFVPVPLVP